VIEAITLRVVRAALPHGTEQALEVAGIHLIIGGDHREQIGACRERRSIARDDRRADPAVVPVPYEPDARVDERSNHRAGSFLAAVVDHDRLRHVRRQAAQGARDQSLFVVRGHDHGHAGAAPHGSQLPGPTRPERERARSSA
jgi:hypothetical protein